MGNSHQDNQTGIEREVFAKINPFSQTEWAMDNFLLLVTQQFLKM